MNEYWRAEIIKILETQKVEAKKMQSELEELISDLDGFLCDIDCQMDIVKREIK